MEQPTQILRPTKAAEFSSAGGGLTDIDLVWTRDGQGKPATGSVGDILPVAEDTYSRYVRARRGDGTTFVLEFQRDVVEPSQFPATWGPVNNSILQAIWRRRTIAASAEGEAQGSAGLSLGYDEHPPLLVCREKGILFHAPSPGSARLGVLDDCRDESMLQHSKLPPWASTCSRFLYDVTSVQVTSMPRFWTAAREMPRGAAADVGGWDRFARDLGSIIDREATRDPAVAKLRGRFPCLGCDQVPRCYPKPLPNSPSPPQPGLAAKRLAPVSFHPFRAIAWREEIVSFDEHCDILGGSPWTAFRARHLPRWAHPGRRIAREALEQSVFGRAEAVDPLTAVSAKLDLFEAIVEEVLRYHRAHGEPHLAVSPATVVSHRLFPGPEGRCEVTLRANLRGAMLEDIMPPPPGPPMWLPPPEQVAPYAHADALRAAEPVATAPADGAGVHEGGFRYARGTQVRVTVGRLWEDEAQRTVECEMNLAGLGISQTDLDGSDRIRVSLAGEGWAGVSLWCRADFERIGEPGGVTLRVYPVKLTTAQVLDLKVATQKRAIFGTAAVYRNYGAFFDIHALGMMLARAVLENSRHSMEKLVADVLPSITTFARAVHASGGRTAWQELTRVFGDLMRSPPLDVFLSDANACWLPGEVGNRGRVPPQVWAEVLATIVACISRGGDAAFCSTSRHDPDRSAFCQPAERLLAKVREIRRLLPQQPALASQRPATAPVAAAAPLPQADPRDARIRELEKSLSSSAARVERLEAEVESLSSARARLEQQATVVRTESADTPAWRHLYESLLGAQAGQIPPPRPGDPAFELVKAVLVDGLESLSAVLTAAAEIGGQEFALEQRNLQRMIRQALAAASQGVQGANEKLAEAVLALRSARQTAGTTIGMLVEAHGKSTQDGSRKLLLTLQVAMKQELELRGAQERKLDDIMSRMNSGLGELIARLYDPVFEEHVRREITKGRAAARPRKG